MEQKCWILHWQFSSMEVICFDVDREWKNRFCNDAAFGELCYDAVFGWHRTPWIKTCIIRYSPARRSANVKARSAERGSWVDSHLSGFSMLSMENDEELRSAADSIFVVCCKFLFLCCWHRIFSIAQTVISDVSDKLSSFLFLLSAVDKKMLMSYVYSECELT